MGHFLVARLALEKFRLDQIVFIPCAHSPLKKFRPIGSDSARLAMLRQGLRGHDWADVWDGEIRNREISYTIDTVRAWSRGRSPRALFWIMGSDQWNLLPSWKNPSELGRQLWFLVFPRPNRPRPRRGFRMSEIPRRIDISATEIRRRLQKNLPVQGMLLPSVERLIRRGGWYR